MTRCPHCKEEIDQLDYLERGYCSTDGDDKNPDSSDYWCQKCGKEVDPYTTQSDDSLIVE